MGKNHRKLPRPLVETPTLSRLAQQINRAHQAHERLLCESLTHARRAGQLLIEVKGQLPHGQFGPWITQHCPFRQSTANLYMQVAREWDRIADSQRVGTLSLRAFSKLLGGPEREAPETGDRSPRLVAEVLRGLQRVVAVLEEAGTAPERIGRHRQEISGRWDEVCAAYANFTHKLGWTDRVAAD